MTMNINAFCKTAALVLATSVLASPAFAAVNPAPAPLAGASLLGLAVIVGGAVMLRRRNRKAAAQH
jgi:LPXTG-motif cell wall-anchored protein